MTTISTSSRRTALRPSVSGTLSFVCGGALLGSIGIFVHHADAGALATTWYRCTFGLLGLSVWLLLRGQAGALRLTWKTGPWVLLAGLLLVASWGLFFAAIERIPTGVAVVLFNVQPMWVLVLGAWWLKEPIGFYRLLSVGVALVGLVLATGVLAHTSLLGESAAPAVTGYWLGVAECLAGAFLTACVTLIAKRLSRMPAGAIAWWQCLVGALLLWPWAAEQGWSVWARAWPWLAGLGLIHTGLAYTLLYVGMPHLSVGRIAVFQFVYPVVAIVIDRLYFDQQLDGLQIIGIVVIAVAICLSEAGSRTSSSARAKASSVEG